MQNNTQQLHESWALAGLMRAQYGEQALPQAVSHVRNGSDNDTAPIWLSVVECLSFMNKR